MVEDVSREVVEGLVYSSNAEFRSRFREHLGAGVDRFVDNFIHSYRRFETMPPAAEDDYRSAWVQAFVHTALNSLLVSTHLLASGYLIQSGNSMRQFAEAMAMALLCAHPSIGVFRRFEADPRRFPTHDALGIANRRRNRRLLDLNKEGWQTLQEITRFYDQYSHVSALGVATLMPFKGEGVVLGSEFDEAKLEMYALELTRRTSALPPFTDVIDRIKELLDDRG